MRDERENLTGDVKIDEPCTLWGTVVGNVRVVDGGRFYLRGRVYGTVHVEAGGRAHLLGSVQGDLVLERHTKVILSGVVGHNAINRGGRLYVQPNATILGTVKTESGKTVHETGLPEKPKTPSKTSVPHRSRKTRENPSLTRYDLNAEV